MKIVTADELASILRLRPRTISRWLGNGVLPGLKLGGEWLIDLDMVSPLFSP